MVLPVEVLTVQAEPLALSSELPGRIEPVRVAEVRARVAGIVVQKRFEEGADVKAGDLLFQIDPAPLKAAVSRAEGELARNRAVLFEAQARVRRYEPLVKIQAVSQQDFDTATADLRSAEAATRSAQADLETARPCAASSPTPTGSCCRACTCAYVRPRASTTRRSWCRNGPCAAPATAAPR